MTDPEAKADRALIGILILQTSDGAERSQTTEAFEVGPMLTPPDTQPSMPILKEICLPTETRHLSRTASGDGLDVFIRQTAR